jgi:hypothetical protein
VFVERETVERILLVTENHFAKAIVSTGEKRVINPTPQGGRTQHAKSDFTNENPVKPLGFRQLSLELQTDGEGFELSPNSQGNQKKLASLVINPTQKHHVDAWIRLVNALGSIDDESIIALAEHVETVTASFKETV